LNLKEVQQAIDASESIQEALSWLNSDVRSLYIYGAVGSLPAFITASVRSKSSLPIVCLVPDEETASYLTSDLEQVAADTLTVSRFPATGLKPYDHEQVPDPVPLIRRNDVLQQLASGFRGILVTSVEAVYENVPAAETLRQETTVIQTGSETGFNTLAERLIGQGFQRVEFVQSPGELAARGGIIDVFPFTGEYPIRIEFFGDEIDSIREIDPHTQRSVSRLTSARIVPNLAQDGTQGEAGVTSFFEHLPADTLLIVHDDARALEHADALFKQAEEAWQQLTVDSTSQAVPCERLYSGGAAIRKSLDTYRRILFGIYIREKPEHVLHAGGKPQPVFNSNMALLRQRLLENGAKGWRTYILCDSRSQEKRLHELLEIDNGGPEARLLVESLHEGFEWPDLRLAVYTDHQIFDRYHRPTARKRRRYTGGLTMREIQNLNPGDFVVHVDYGVGKFAGMEKITVRDKLHEAVRVLFADNDLLYVNVNALHKLHKYTGREGHQPKLTKLGSGQWERTKARAKKRVKDIARDLIQLYAQRKASPGFGFRPDTIWQRELEASFQFEDTPDQAVTSESVKQDMEQPTPMDRLVCGDVGFGKTEIAIRAAFKAVQDGKQVAVLVPTTILARQHHETFKKRLANYPVRIESISRFRTAAEQKEMLRKLAQGEIDIIIGTHRLASKDVTFKDLGLLVLDEEQRFGVSVKEHLRKLRANVDTLTLTATPIPRTLQFSLLGARDLSIINTPPPNRQPIVTEIHTFDKNLIRDAILYETSRGGQVFFIHNRVQTIEEVSAMIRSLVPDTRIGVAHGQMKPADLERIMMSFIDGKYDVLVSTNIIESGLDISNANTIIINHADRFGLSELHQLRGRVGRSDRKAFCYLLVPSIHTLTREARQRLQAIEEFSELGSGFNIAMRDLDIRGAGNMLGAEQSGFIEDVGFETFHRILDEAVQELRTEEFSGLFTTASIPRSAETVVDVEEDAYLPEHYVTNNVERLNIYRRISEAENEQVLSEIRDELTDRFGPIAPEALNLFTAAEIKLQAQGLRLPKITYKNRRLFLEMPTQEEDSYFYEHIFHGLLEQLSRLDRRYVLKETASKRLRAIVQDVPDLAAARDILHRLKHETPQLITAEE
jgi:transcription-repair coupling factor (superfamily II helicase)